MSKILKKTVSIFFFFNMMGFFVCLFLFLAVLGVGCCVCPEWFVNFGD